MLIQQVPQEFQPIYRSNYPGYSAGKNIEEICYDYFINQQSSINSDYIYLPVFWTSYYVTHGYGQNINGLYNWLSTLDKTKKYFTIVQYASGIHVQNFDLNITVFSAGGGGLNIKNHDTVHDVTFHGLKRSCFFGKKGTYDIPLICLPEFPNRNLNRDIYCSFMGRFDTHKCRIDMKNVLTDPKYLYKNSENFNEYCNILNRSVFTLAPRGFGYTSFRIYEAILAGSIPIYIWEDKKILPFEDILDYDTFSIVIHISELNKLEDILSKVNVLEMQAKIESIKHMFTFDKTFDYIIDKIKI